MIELANISVLVGGRPLLEQSSAVIYPGHRIGLVGANGCGKSTLMQLLSQQLAVDGGEVRLPPRWQVVHIRQDVPALPQAAIDYVLDGHQPLRQLEQQLKAAEASADGHAIAHLHAELEAIGAWQLPSEAARLLAGLGFDDSAQQRPVASFSGGWRMRLNLAQALLAPSDLLLLDEPTNHLDLDAVVWLEEWLSQCNRTVVLVSHDREFLDQVVTDIIHIEQQRLHQYKGNYSSFEGQRAARIQQQQAAASQALARRAELQRFVDRFRAKASKAKQAQSRLKMLARLEVNLPAHGEQNYNLAFEAARALPHPLLQLDELQAGYGSTVILEKVKFNLVPGSRIGLLGRNGAGKSTLMQLLAGTLPPLAGVRSPSPGLVIGYFSQHQVEELEANATPVALLSRIAGNTPEQKLRDYLGRFGFGGERAFAAVGPFSGGERARLCLALIIWQRPNLLLLDEPTNHLDLELRHNLTLALQEFEGAMVLVSHDRHLLGACCDDFYLVAHGRVEPFAGDLDDYRKLLVQLANAAASGNGSGDGGKNDRKEQRRQAADRRAQLKPLRDRLRKQEQQLEQLSGKLALLDERLLDSTLYDGSRRSELSQLLQQQGQLRQQLAEVESAWMATAEELEQVDNDDN